MLMISLCWYSCLSTQSFYFISQGVCLSSGVNSIVFKPCMFCGQFVYINLTLSFPISSPWSVRERGCESPLLLSCGFSFLIWLAWVRDSQNVLFYRKNTWCKFWSCFYIIFKYVYWAIESCLCCMIKVYFYKGMREWMNCVCCWLVPASWFPFSALAPHSHWP